VIVEAGALAERPARRLDITSATADDPPVTNRAVSGVDELLGRARSRIGRFEPEAAWSRASAGEALIVDLRCHDDRVRRGIVPGSIHVPRTVLEWRVDPSSRWHNPHLGEHDGALLLLCTDGFSSSLAAATLVDLGFARAGDVVGGFTAWRRSRLPVVRAPRPAPGVLAGMAPPDR
jgi:rhodanese-related sulfurtransferase